MKYYTTIELAELTLYKTRRTLLQALHNNQKKDSKDRDSFLSAIWAAKFRFGKSWVFEQSAIKKILGL